MFFFKKPEKKIIKQSDLMDRDLLHGNGHRIFGYRPSPRDWSNLIFQKVKFAKKKCGILDQDHLHGNGR